MTSLIVHLICIVDNANQILFVLLLIFCSGKVFKRILAAYKKRFSSVYFYINSMYAGGPRPTYPNISLALFILGHSTHREMKYLHACWNYTCEYICSYENTVM